MKPTFIGIGAQKCASTWLHQILADHPEAEVPERKEIDFFSFHYDHGYAWYERHFSSVEARTARGEISPSYFCEPAVPRRVFRYAPDARIVLSLRDPVERALSNHRHEVRVGHVCGPDLRFESGLVNNPMYVEQGLYATHLKRWLKWFPREQLLIVLMDDIERDPAAVARQVYAFLGIDGGHRPRSLDERSNRSFANRHAGLAGLKDALYAQARLPGRGWIWTVSTGLGLRALYRRLNVVPSEQLIPPPAPETLQALRKRFAPEVRELASILDRPLDTWLKAT